MTDDTNKKPREFVFTVMPEEFGFNIVWDMAKCNFHQGTKLITGEIHVIEYSAYEALKAEYEKLRHELFPESRWREKYYDKCEELVRAEAMADNLAAALEIYATKRHPVYQDTAAKALAEYRKFENEKI